MRYTEAGAHLRIVGRSEYCRCFKPWFMLLSYCDNIPLGMLNNNMLESDDKTTVTSPWDLDHERADW